MLLHIKILSYKKPQRFAVRRTVYAAKSQLSEAHPELELEITEVKALSEIENYTTSVILPSLVVNDRLVCTGRYPKKEEIVRWLEEALNEPGNGSKS